MLFCIDELELKYFEFNPLVTDFWLIKEFLKRKNDVSVTVKKNLYIKNARARALCYKAELKNENIVLGEEKDCLLDDFNVIYFRPDPPVDTDFLNAVHILDYTKTFVINSPVALRNKNEKLYVNEFVEFAPKNIVTSSLKLIKEFLKENEKIVLKPLNRCFSSGVFYLENGDKNTNTIINTVTENEKTKVMVQEYLPEIEEGDKRLTFIDGEIFEECVQKSHPEGDFKFTQHAAEFLKKGCLTFEEKKMQNIIAEKMLSDGVYMAGLDVIGNKIIEINFTSPCFFIKEVNENFKINFEQKIVDKLEKLMDKRLKNY